MAHPVGASRLAPTVAMPASSSSRGRHRVETEVLPQRTHQIAIFRWRPLQAETGVEMLGCHVFRAPKTGGFQLDVLLGPIIGWQLQAQVKLCATISGKWLISIRPSSETLPKNPMGFPLTPLKTSRQYDNSCRAIRRSLYMSCIAFLMTDSAANEYFGTSPGQPALPDPGARRSQRGWLNATGHR